ncbi:putative protein [Arabidopsis thaliana]|uniref:Uncharacterized protein F1I16_10 n=1 Tax=Arabidopsis thaliana TaxID=3702 RepID=Q9M062_ARATH|nr:putative protein [Arabidopsis thaliana]
MMGISKTEINLRRLLSAAPNQQNQSKLMHYVATLREQLEQLSEEKTPEGLPRVTKAKVNEYYEKIEAVASKIASQEPETEVSDEPFAKDSTSGSSPKIEDEPRSPTSPQLRRRIVPASSKEQSFDAADADSSKPIKLDTAAQAHIDKHRKLQEDLTDEMVVLARQLKERSQAISQSVQNTEKPSEHRTRDNKSDKDIFTKLKDKLLPVALDLRHDLCVHNGCSVDPASTLASVCGRVARAQAVSAIVNRSSLVPKPSLLRPFVSRGFPYSTATEPLKSDQTLIQVIDSEIKDSFEADDHDADEETIDSSDFPFKIEDNPGHRTVTLTREYNGEQIKVEVSMPGLAMDENEDDVDDDEDGDGRHEKSNESSIPLVVTVTKKSGLSLEFSCTAFPDEIVIDGLSVNRPDDSSEEQLTYDGPDFQELDENMRKSFHKFLETRGIKASATDFLYEYMMKKDSREYLLWLKKLKTFVQE